MESIAVATPNFPENARFYHNLTVTRIWSYKNDLIIIKKVY